MQGMQFIKGFLYHIGQQNESKGIRAIIRQRTCDDKVGVRKAALEVKLYCYWERLPWLLIKDFI